MHVICGLGAGEVYLVSLTYCHILLKCLTTVEPVLSDHSFRCHGNRLRQVVAYC